MQRSTLTPGRKSLLYERIRFDTELEGKAFGRLSRLDADGCREEFRALLAGLDLSAVGKESRPVVHLLLDVLLRVDRRIHAGPRAEGVRQSNRARLIEQFAACRSAKVARDRFLPALNRLLAPLVRAGDGPRPHAERARRYIDENYDRRISLASVAERLNVSASHLSRLFRRDTGTTVTHYIQNVRLGHAVRLLERGESTISEIAYRVGYQNYRDFHRNFVKYEKSSPRRFLERIRRG